MNLLRLLLKNTTGKSPLCKATKSIVTVAIVDTPAAKPSKPSIKLTVLVIPTIQKIVTGIAKYSKKDKITKWVCNKINSNIKCH